MISRIRRAVRRAVNRPYFAGSDVRIGRGVEFGRGVRFNSDRVRIGDGVVIQDDVVVDADSFSIGDYGTIYRRSYFPGPGSVTIGHNFWLGSDAIVDCQGGTVIGNNVGVGAHSQLWTHMKFGDVLLGCRFHSEGPLTIGDDAWLVGHCLVSPVHIGARSLAMLGSLITRDMEPDRVYAGSPAKDVTDSFGPPFEETSPGHRTALLEERLRAFALSEGLDHYSSRFEIVEGGSALAAGSDGKTIFNVSDRTYTKTGSEIERKAMRYLLPDAKFVPAGDPD